MYREVHVLASASLLVVRRATHRLERDLDLLVLPGGGAADRVAREPERDAEAVVQVVEQVERDRREGERAPALGREEEVKLVCSAR
jgi:hypothetical protein